MQLPPQQNARLIAEKIPLLALSIVSCVITPLVQGEAVEQFEILPVSTRMANVVVSYAVYLGQFFYPAGLAIFYPYPENGLPFWQTAGAFLLLVSITVIAGIAVWRRKYPFLPVGWFWFLGMLVPVVGLVQVGQQARADRYTYLPEIGLAVALAWGLNSILAARPNRDRIFLAAVVLVSVVLGICTQRQTAYWLNSERLWRRALDCTSRNAPAHYNLGLALTDQEGKLDEAIEQFHRAIDIQPDYISAHNNLGVALSKHNRVDEAIGHYRKALGINPKYALTHANLGMALERQKQYDEAAIHYRQALDLEPRNAEVRYNLANVLLTQGRNAEAAEEYVRALKINRGYVEARYNLGVVLYHGGQYADAIAQWGEIVRNDPKNVMALNRLSLALAACPDASVRNGPRAVELAGQAVELTVGRDPAVLDTLAAAYAESGRFAEAVATAERALALVERRPDSPLAQALRERLQLYRAGSPYHDAPRTTKRSP